ncbi:phosphopyruvate hydratase [Candidatus Gracilibacteria bacterium CG17_big_fil_post_rev_8_21_14_2_50_48_13]|nr:MAG: phosphopyruvate hydratase [Candidatus Gracilibacteria bacterium CG17_big_fil_post_rev_8_21_14_2_50_48_13]
MKISNILAREVLDSRGTPTIEVEVHTTKGIGTAIVPSGASTGTHEALELRDGDASRFFGKGVRKAVDNVHTIIKPALLGQNVLYQKELDRAMLHLDGTPNKSKLGANAILAVSMALMKASSIASGIPLYERIRDIAEDITGEVYPSSTLLPRPMMNIINGGRHASSGLAIQEFMIVPTGAKNFHEALRIGAEVFHTLKDILAAKGHSTAVGDEGGFAPTLRTSRKALDLIMEAAEKSGHRNHIALALDPAASEFYADGRYTIDNTSLTSQELTEYYMGLLRDYPLISIEDSHAEDDWDGWISMTLASHDIIQLVGDDLFVTNKERLALGIEKGVANAILIKPNQIGSITETIETIHLAREHDMRAVISHRSGETEDTTIADIAVGLSLGQIKTGSLSRSERIAKYNRLLRIEEALGKDARLFS